MQLAREMALIASIPETEALVIRSLPSLARFSLRLDPSIFAARTPIAGLVLDVPINRYASSDETLAARLGPDEWLLISPEAAGATMAAALTSQCAGLHHSLVDVSHGYAGFSISGSQATVILNSGCPLDMTVAAFPAGMATRTLLGKAEIVLLRRPGAMLFELQCGRSFAKYVAGFLFEASRELRAARAQRD